MKRDVVKKQKENIEKNEIKDYLYLNMDFLETFIAQIDGGYNTLQISDDARGHTDIQGSRTNTAETGIEGKLNEIIEHFVKLNGYIKATTQSAPTYNIVRWSSIFVTLPRNKFHCFVYLFSNGVIYPFDE